MNEFDLRNYLYNNPLTEKKEDSKKGNKEEQKRMEGAIRDDRDHIKDLEKDIKDNEKKLAKLKKDEPKDVSEGKEEKEMEEGMGGSYYEDDDKKKMTKESLKSMIREKITSILNEEEISEEEISEEEVTEQEDVEVEDDENVDVDVEKDVNVDVKDEVDVDDESVESDIEVKTSIPGESADVDAVLGLLTKAQEEAEGMADETLLDQIGNTITYFTRKHVVKSSD